MRAVRIAAETDDFRVNARTAPVFKAAFGAMAVEAQSPGSASEDYSEYVIAGVPSLFWGLGGIDPKVIADMGLESAKMHTVPLGTEHDVFCPDPSVAKVPGRIVVVTSADVPLKGLLVLLEALPKIRVEREDAHVVCVGKARARHDERADR